MRGTALGVGGTDDKAGKGTPLLLSCFMVEDELLVDARKYGRLRSAVGDGGFGKAKDCAGEEA